MFGFGKAYAVMAVNLGNLDLTKRMKTHSIVKTWLWGWVVAGLLTLATNISKAQAPANDNFSNRFDRVGFFWTDGLYNNTSATTETGEPVPGYYYQLQRTLWWTWQAPTSGVVRVDTMGSSYDTLLQVYTGGSYSGGSLGGFTYIAFDNNSGGNGTDKLTFAATAGTRYNIQVGGRRTTSTGNARVNLNYLPTVRVSSPLEGAIFPAPANITVVAAPQIYTGSVSRIEFFIATAKTTNVVNVTNAPYSMTFSNLSADSYQFYARVFDNRGDNSLYSTRVNVTVSSYGTQITSPANGAQITGVSNVTVTASAFSALAITNIQFLVDGAVIGSSVNNPGSVVWSNLVAGGHSLQAISYDTQGQAMTSAVVNVTVKPFVFAIRAGSVWKYLDNGSDQGTAWVAPDFDDSTWAAGPAELGFGDGDEATVINGGPSGARYITTYFRHAFTVQGASSVTNLICRLKKDDGAVLYLNGQELYRDVMPTGPVTYQTFASFAPGDDGANFTNSSRSPAFLVEGTNVLAVEVHQNSVSSSDNSFDFEMVAEYAAVPPVVAITTPTNNSFWLLDAPLTLTALASDADGSVASVEFYAGQTLLGQGGGSGGTFTFVVTNLALGTNTFTAVATDNMGFKTTSAAVTVNVFPRLSRWVAFNDHAPGSGTHTNTSIYDAFGYNAGTGGALTNIITGAPLGAALQIRRSASGTDTGGSNVQAPPGTPAHAIFNGYVNFAGSPYSGIEITDGAGYVTNLFTGLNPAHLYSFRGSAIRGNPSYTNRWTLVQIIGARSARNAHSGGVLTSNTVSSLGGQQAAFNAGYNLAGDVVGWDDILPGANGSFAVVCSLYSGPVPGGSSNGGKAYAIDGLRLEDFGPQPVVTLTSPANGATYQGPTNLTLTATASGAYPMANVVFYAGNTLLGSDATAPYSLVWTNAAWATNQLYAVAWDSDGNLATSAVVTVTVNAPPPNLEDPVVFAFQPAAGNITNLTAIQVVFNENVTGVNAGDLLINGVAATNVTGSGSNYIFYFAQPPLGLAQVSWAVAHGIQDTGYPPRAFDALGAGATWSYNVVDGVPPTVASKSPAAGTRLTNLTEVTVNFSEPVTNVDARDFLVNGVPAFNVAGAGSSYTFYFAQPGYGTVSITWTNNHGITDLAGNPFNRTGAGATWSYTMAGREVVLVASNAFWQWLPGTNEVSSPTNAWRLAGHDASHWLLGQEPFYYDDNNPPVYSGNTLLSNMRSNYGSIYLRHEFMLTNAHLYTNVTFYYRMDDGLLAYLNDYEVGRTNLPAGELSYTNLAPLSRNSVNWIPWRATNAPLAEGANVFAVRGFNNNLNTSSDLLVSMYATAEYLDPALLVPQIAGVLPAPGRVYYLTNLTVTFSKPVQNVDAADLLVNGTPATSVSGSNQTYTFAVAQPAYGPVAISWAVDHGITDLGGGSFDAASPGAQWSYKLVNPEAPVIADRTPANGAVVVALTNVTVLFNKPVTGVEAADFLVNGAPAASVTGSGSNYVFGFAQPAYGTVNFAWTADPGIVDAANSGHVFDPSEPDAQWQVNFVYQVPPVIAQVTPAPGNITNLTAVQVAFSEAVTGVEASDLLINGVPATMVGVVNSSNFVFGFPQPPIGLVEFAWAANHGIADTGFPVLPFDENGPGARWSYNVVDGVPPTVSSRAPAPAAEVTSLTQIAVQFSEAVVGVDAADLLVNGLPANSVTALSSSNYQFNVTSPGLGPVQVSWAANHGITDATGNPFADAGWSFVLYNPAAPVITARLPAPGTTTNALTNVLVQFSEAVTGVDAADLLVNGVPASSVAFVGGYYDFRFSQPAYGTVQFTWDSGHGIASAAQPANAFESFRTNASWQLDLVFQAPPVVAAVSPARNSTVASLSQITVTFSENVINVNASDLLVNGVAATNMTGSGSNYVFSFPAQPPGPVAVTWAADHGILDLGVPAAAFDHTAADASWNYTVADIFPPTVLARTPAAGSVLSNLFQIQVTFNEPVMNVDAGDLLVNGAPAYGLSGGGSNYTFAVNQPGYGPVSITWSANHGITDISGNPFDGNGSGATWSYTLQLVRVTLVNSNSLWRFYKGYDEASSPADAWRQRAYSDVSWSNAPAPFFFGESLTGTLLSDMRGYYTSIYMRRQFVVNDPAMLTNLVLRAIYDDGFIAWINGVEVVRLNMGVAGNPDPYNVVSSANANEAVTLAWPSYSLSSPLPSSYLVAGTNVLAIHAANASLTNSSDFVIDAQLTAEMLTDPASEPPRLLAVAPASGDIFYLTNLTVTFTKAVTNVDAADLLVNGAPASAVAGANNLYVFSFPQPAYGLVQITWATNHGITDLNASPNLFDGQSPTAQFQYHLLNPNAPIISVHEPGPDSVVGRLTAASVTFSKPVANVEAGDLLVNGISATGLTNGGATYTFTFPQPDYGPVQFTWRADHGITDLEVPPNAFEAARPGAAWQVTLRDLTAPFIAAVNPPAGAAVTNLTSAQVIFSEAVVGVSAGDLLVNGVPATNVTGAGSNYLFSFAPPNATLVVFTWAPFHEIADLAAQPNPFDGGALSNQWQYATIDNIPPQIVSLEPPPGATVRELRQLTVVFNEAIQGIDGGDLLINGMRANYVAGSGAGPYTFFFAEPATGAVEVAWAPEHGIRDLANPPNDFAGEIISYILDPQMQLAGAVVINEIMYHPSSENILEEYIELHNTTAAPINLTAWRFNRGITFTFPNVVLPANGYLVVAANTNVFRTKYPSVNNVIGNWEGLLSNGGEEIRLVSAAGEVVDSVTYADEGDWAIRQIGPLDVNLRGWKWFASHDGGDTNTATGLYEYGRSLELVNPRMPNEYGQNWLASQTINGSPGGPNTVAQGNIAPLVLDVKHFPIVPASTNQVTITARIVDEEAADIAVNLYYRQANSTNLPGFTTVPMYDDGAHNDGAAGDGFFGVILPARTNLTVIEYYVEAIDGQNHRRTWPAAARQLDGTFAQTANALYQVDNNLAAATGVQATHPLYRLILTEPERVTLMGIAGSANRNSDAAMNATFITSDADGVKVRHNAAVRIRGAGSRGVVLPNPPNFRVDIPTDRKWNGISEINLNTQYTHAQLVGGALAHRAGIPGAEVRAVQVRINGLNYAQSGSPQFGSYVYVESMNADWADRVYPNNNGGNFYRASTGSHNADLTYRDATAPVTYYQNQHGYSKTSNQSENDWSDLDRLTYAFSRTTGLSESAYAQAIRTNANVEMWMRYFAACSLMEYSETSICNGRGDDYAMYRGIADPRFILVPHDFDTIFGQGGTGNTSESIWVMLNITNANAIVPVLNRFMLHNEFAPIYFRELKRLAETVFTEDQVNPLFDRLLGGWVPNATITSMKNFNAARRASVLAQLPLAFSVNVPLSVVSGYYQSTGPNVQLTGQANAIETREVRVNGNVASWLAWQGRWTNTVALVPGLNQVLVQCLGEAGQEVARTNVTIWYSSGSGVNVSGTLSANTTWVAGSSPYNVTGDLTVPAGVTLTIQPGTTVYLGSNAAIIVNGRLLAEGTPEQRIHFTRAPAATHYWRQLRFANSTNEQRITCANLEFGGNNGNASVYGTSARLYLRDLLFNNSASSWVDVTSSSLTLLQSVLPSVPGHEMVHFSTMPANGHALIQSNLFGSSSGYNDIIDFTGGNRPGPIVQFLDNIFLGGVDDVLDLDGTDAHIEGNIFLNVHMDAVRDSASHAISTGLNGSDTSELVIARNLIFNADHGVLLKEGCSAVIQNNTIANIWTNVAAYIAPAAVSFGEPNRGVTGGAGALVEGNIFWDLAEQRAHVNFTNGVMYWDATYNLFPGTNHPGAGNISADPLFVNYNPATMNYQNIRSNLALQPGSPARGAGPNGLDMGALVPAGATISGEPALPTARRTVSLKVAGPGITHYRYRVNGGSYPTNEYPVAVPLVLSNLVEGLYTVYAQGKNSAGFWQSGEAQSKTFRIQAGVSDLRLNELLASNQRAYNHYDTTPDVLELYNSGAEALDLGGVRITDDPLLPDKFEFPPGATLAAGGYLVLLANDYDGTPGYHLEFNLPREGGTIYLFDSVARGGALIDSLTYGIQITDLSIGRLPNGDWGLTRPTFGGPNQAAPTGDASKLKLNEWLAVGNVLLVDDFVELFNPTALPVDLGGLFLTDTPNGWPTRHAVAPLSYIPAFACLALVADGDSGKGADHLGFKLRAEQGELALFDRNTNLIDYVWYGPQQPNISNGRSPNGSTNIVFFEVPTPGAGNPNVYGQTNITTTTISLVTLTNLWRYEDSGEDLGTTWREPGYADASWLEGAAMFCRSPNAVLPLPTNTLISTEVYQSTLYFRARFNFTGSTNGYNLALHHVIDDGAVVYLNGEEIYRFNMPAGTVNYSTLASANVGGSAPLTGPVILPCTNVLQGENVLAVEVHQPNLNSPDATMAVSLDLTRSVTNILGATITFNEVMALADTFTNVTGQASDWVEFYNAGDTDFNLSGYGLTDDTANPYRWVFPAGSLVPARGYLVVACDAGLPVSTNEQEIMNCGFGLKANGGAVYLYENPEQGGYGVYAASLQYGIQTPDYSLSRLPGNSLALSLPSPGTANIAAALGNPMLLKINEWMPNDKDGADDWFEIYNPNPQPVALGGLYLTDDIINPLKYNPLAAHSFIGAGSNAFLKILADDNLAGGANHVAFKLRNDGESIGLATAGGQLIDQITFTGSAPGVSEGRFPDGAATVVTFPKTASPGESNYRLLTNVVISEVLAHTDPPVEDAIELQNLTGAPVDISGWFLSDKKSFLNRYRIPDGTVLAPYGFKVFYEYQFFNTNNLDDIRNFSLSGAKGDQVYLSTANLDGSLTGYRGSVKFGASLNGVSFGRYLTTDGREEFVAMSRTTFGADAPENLAEFRTGTGMSNAYPAVGPVVIRQIMYHPPDLGTNDNVRHEFIELYNTSTVAAKLYDLNHPTNTWRLRDAVDFEFPAGTEIPPGGSLLVVSFNPAVDTNLLAEFRAVYGLQSTLPIVGPYRGKLDNSSENVELYQPDEPVPPPSADAGLTPYVLVEQVKYYDTAPWPTAADGFGYSLQRVANLQFGNDPVNWVAAPVSFGQTNATVVNHPPALGDLNNWVVKIGQAVHFTAVATDPDLPADTLTFSLGPGAPTNATVNPVSGEFQWTPGYEHSGTNYITVRVTDSGTPAASDAKTFVVFVVRQQTLAPQGGGMTLTWDAAPNVIYRVQYKNSLTDPNWTDLPGDVVAGGNQASKTDPTAAAAPKRFYRILILP